MTSQIQTDLERAKRWPVQFAKAQMIYNEGDQSEAIYRVDKGCVRIVVNGEAGERQIIRFVYPGELFGVCLERYETSAEAVSNVSLTHFDLYSVIELCKREPLVALRLMEESNRLYRNLAIHLMRILHSSSLERVHWFLGLQTPRIQAIGNDETLPKLRIDGRDIAQYLGIAPETLSRCLNIEKRK